MKYVWMGLLFVNLAYAGNSCGPQEGKFSWDRAVKVGDVTTFFNPRLQLDAESAALIAFEDGKNDASFANGVCRALGKKSGAVGQIVWAYEFDSALAVFVEASGRVTYMHDIGKATRYSTYDSGVVQSVSCR